MYDVEFKGFKEVRKLYCDKLINLCREKNWYTRGTNEDFMSLLKMCDKDNITTDDILKITSDIKLHSDDEEREYTEYAFEILNICYTFLEEIKDEE